MKVLAICVLFLACLFPTPAKADSVSVQQTPFDGFFGIGTLIPNASSGLLIFPGPYQLTFQTIPSSQQNTFLDGSLACHWDELRSRRKR